MLSSFRVCFHEMRSSNILSLLKSAFLKSAFSILLFSLLSFKRIIGSSVSCPHRFSSTFTFSSIFFLTQGCHRLYSNLPFFLYFLYQSAIKTEQQNPRMAEAVRDLRARRFQVLLEQGYPGQAASTPSRWLLKLSKEETQQVFWAGCASAQPHAQEKCSGGTWISSLHPQPHSHLS